MRKTVASMSVLLLFFIVTACSMFDTPSAVVKKFHMALAEGKVSEAHDLLTRDAQEMLKRYGGGVSVLSGRTKEIQSKNGIREITIKSEDVMGETASVEFDVLYGDGSKKEDSEKLVKEDGKWRLAVSK